MVKIVALVRRKQGLTTEQFLDYWQNRHSKLVAALPGLRGYVQNPAIDPDKRNWPYDGLVEVWFDDVAAVKAAFESPESDAVRADEPNFTSAIDWFLATEHPIVDPPVHGG